MSDEYEVEKIVDKRVKNGKVEYKIKWVGYPMSDCTWEPLKNLENIQKMIDDYNLKLNDTHKDSNEKFLGKKKEKPISGFENNNINENKEENLISGNNNSNINNNHNNIENNNKNNHEIKEKKLILILLMKDIKKFLLLKEKEMNYVLLLFMIIMVLLKKKLF